MESKLKDFVAVYKPPARPEPFFGFLKVPKAYKKKN